MASEHTVAGPAASVRTSPWRSRELLGIAKLYSQDSDLWVFRRFNRLHLFNILYLQHELLDLEKKLLQFENGNWVAKNDTAEGKISLHQLVMEIRRTLKLYDEATSAQIRTQNHVSPRPKKVRDLAILSHSDRKELCRELGIDCSDHRSGVSALEKGARGGCGSCFNFSLPSFSTDQKVEKADPYVKVAEGLASIAAVEKSWMHRFVDGHDLLRKMFAKGNVNAGTVPMLIYSEKAIQRAELIIVNIGFSFLLICPIFLLSYVEGRAAKLGSFVAFVITGSVLTSGLINAGNIGNLAVMAGYTAILVVFLSNNVN